MIKTIKRKIQEWFEDFTHKPTKNIMTKITSKLIRRLEWETGAGRMDCKKALDNSNGDIGEAIKWLKMKGIYISL